MKKGLLGTSILSLVVILLLGALLSACAPAAQQPVEAKTLKVGCIMPFTGGASAWGLATRPPTEIYADLLNESGGIKIGDDIYKVALTFEDDNYMPAPGAAAARKLIYSNGVSAIVGYFSTGMAAISPVTNADKVILICRTGSGVVYNPKKDPYTVFGLASSEIVINQALATMKAFPEAKVLCWTGTEAAKQAAGASLDKVDKYFEDTYGIKSVRVYYPEGTTNYTPYIEQMAKEGTQVIFSGGNVFEIALMAKQRWGMGYKWPIGQTSTVVSVGDLVKISGQDASQGLMNPWPAPWELKMVKVAPEYVNMANNIRARFAEKYPDGELYIGSFDLGVNQLAQYIGAMQQAGTTDPDKVMGAFRSGTFETFMGKYTLSGTKTYGSPVVFGNPCAMGQIKGNKTVYVSESPLLDIDELFPITGSMMSQ